MNNLRRFFKEEDGMGTVEVVLILVVLIALVTIFQSKIKSVMNKIMEKIEKGADGIKVS